VFALDSVPAVLAVTRNPFIVYSSNVPRLRYLRPGLALILVFTGAKMLTARWFHAGAGVSALIIIVVLAMTISASALAGRRGGVFYG